MTAQQIRHAYAVLAVALLGCGCASSQPRVTEVSLSSHKVTVGAAEEDLFVSDHASHFRFPAATLPLDQQRQEVLVRWNSATVECVMLEYRQLNVPNKISEQTRTPSHQQWAMFEIRGKDFVEGGPISAWRVSLWRGDEMLADQRSALW